MPISAALACHCVESPLGPRHSLCCRSTQTHISGVLFLFAGTLCAFPVFYDLGAAAPTRNVMV